MAKPIANVDPTTDTFDQWLTQTNEVLLAMSENAVTVDSTSGGAGVTGNGYVNGSLSVTSFSANTIRGGSVASSANLFVISAMHSNNTITANTFGVFTGIGGMTTGYAAANLVITTVTTTTSNLHFVNAYSSGTFAANTISVSNNIGGSSGANLTISTNAVVNGSLTANTLILSNTCDVKEYSVTLSSTTGSPLSLFTINAAAYPTAKLTVQAKNGVDTEISEVILASNASNSGTNSGANVYLTVYGTVAAPPGANVGLITASQSGNTVTVSFTQSVSTSTVKILATLFKY